MTVAGCALRFVVWAQIPLTTVIWVCIPIMVLAGPIVTVSISSGRPSGGLLGLLSFLVSLLDVLGVAGITEEVKGVAACTAVEGLHADLVEGSAVKVGLGLGPATSLDGTAAINVYAAEGVGST